MARRLLLLALCVAFGSSCSRDPAIEQRPVTIYSPRAFPVVESEAYSVIYAGGDFEPAASRPPTASIFLRDVGKAMPDLPADTRSLIVDVSQRDFGWRGVVEVPKSGPINVLVWPSGQACRLTRDIERRTDMTLGVFGRHFMVAGGRSLDGAQVPHTYVGDLATGAIERLGFGLRSRRVRPTITPFPLRTGEPSSAIVAGGADPDSDAPIATAEIYSPKAGAPSDVGDFDQERIELSEARADHGSVLLSSGETLLVGGRGLAGPLRTMEIIDPVTRRARTAGVALLAVARKRPTVLRLANGEILVAGGLDALGREVSTLEWFADDASRPTKRPVELVAGKRRAFVSLPAGGALGVVLPDDATTPDFKSVWVISADGTLEPGTPLDPAGAEAVRLFPGGDGAPILWTGTRWLRWQPWRGAFDTIPFAPDAGPGGDVIASGDSGLALWLDELAESTTGFRFAARTRFASVPKPLLVTGTDGFAPDRLAGTTVRFDAARGLLLDPGASAFLTDVTFADFDLDADVTSAAPLIVLRPDDATELEVGGPDCAFAQSATRRLVVRRRRDHVTVGVDDGPERTCAFALRPESRLAVGVRGQGSGTSGIRNLRVSR